MKETGEKGVSMGRVRFTPEQIIGKLQEAEVLFSQGTSFEEAIRKLGFSERAYYPFCG